MSVATSAVPALDTTQSLSPEKARECSLKLLVCDSFLAAGVFHQPTQTFLTVFTPTITGKFVEKRMVQKFIDFAHKNPQLQLSYNSVTVQFLSQAVTLVPNTLYNQASKEHYMQLVEPLGDTKYVVSDRREENDFTTVFSEDKRLVVAVKDNFSGAKLSHTASFIIPRLIKDYGNDAMQRVFAYVLPDKLQLIVIQQDKPVFYNIFSYTSPEDFIYFILLVYKKLDFNPEKTQLIFLGEILSQSKLFEAATKYIRNIGFGKRPTGINFSEELNQLPPHFYYSIFCMV